MHCLTHTPYRFFVVWVFFLFCFVFGVFFFFFVLFFAQLKDVKYDLSFEGRGSLDMINLHNVLFTMYDVIESLSSNPSPFWFTVAQLSSTWVDICLLQPDGRGCPWYSLVTCSH